LKRPPGYMKAIDQPEPLATGVARKQM